VAANSAEKVIDELSLLLTSGRLSAENKAVILQYYNTALASDTPEKALKVAQHLILASPEFQTSNTVRKSGAQREPSSSSGLTAKPYKAIINVYLFGGMDSFYMLSPHSTCPLYTGTFVINLSENQKVLYHFAKTLSFSSQSIMTSVEKMQR
jgi:hypothetical protein